MCRFPDCMARRLTRNRSFLAWRLKIAKLYRFGFRASLVKGGPMKAVRFDKYGGIDVLHVDDVPVPEPAQGQVLVQVKAASINPGEAKIREGLMHARWPATFPSGEGSDLAGIVTKIGAGVEGVKVGDEVIGWTDN